MKITQKLLHNFIFYDFTTGKCFWRFRDRKYFISDHHYKTWNKRFANKEINSIGGGGYYRLSIFGKRYLLHRLIWIYVYGASPKNIIDHKDQNKLNNRISNIIESTKIKNAQNIKLREDNSSGIMGVSWCKERNNWEAYITIDKIRKNLGRYHNFNDAVRVREEAEIKYGFSKYHGRK